MDILGSNLVTITGAQHHDTVLDRLWGLVQSREKVDFGLAGSGRLLRAHQLILGLFFRPQQLLDIGPQYWHGSSLDSLLEFVYLGTTSVPEDQLDTLLELARQLDFAMLVDALLAGKNSVRVTNPSASYPRMRIRDFGSTNSETFFSGSGSTILPSANINSLNSKEVMDRAQSEWTVVLPKVEPDSDDDYNNSSVRPQTVKDATVGLQQDAGGIIAPEMDAETGCRHHLSDNSVVIKTEIDSESDQVDDSGGGSAADQNDDNYLDGFLSVQMDINDEEAVNLQSPADDSSGKLDDDVGFSVSKVLKVESCSDNRVHYANDVEGDDDSVSKHSVDLKGGRVALKRTREDLCEQLTTSRGSGLEKLGKSSRESATNSDEMIMNEAGATASRSKKRLECSICRKIFKRQNELTVHSRTHSGEKPYQCQLCHKAFRQKGHLIDHGRIHTGEKPYKCEVCSKEYREKGQLRNHQRIHTGEKPYKCQLCSMTFGYLSALINHGRIHSSETPYKCHVCSRAFKRHDGLRAHFRLHPGMNASASAEAVDDERCSAE